MPLLKAGVKIIGIEVTNFRNFKIWQQGIELVIDVYKLAALLPKEEKYGLRSQTTQAVLFIPSNIAEGSSLNQEQKMVNGYINTLK